jgi:DNA end-binding protein Ku
MYSGSHPREGLDLDMLHKEDLSPIRYARICRKDGKEVPWEDITKGYEYQDGDYVELTQKDFERADVKMTKTIDIQQFANADEIDIRYYEKPYYLEPAKGAEKAYALLRESLAKSDKLAVVTYVFHQREHLGALMPVGPAIVLNQLRFHSDIREPVDLNFPDKKEVTKTELDMALSLIKQETKPFAAEDYHDTYTEELQEIIQEKIKGAKPKKHGKAPKKTESKDLMGALKESLKKTKK